MGVPCLHGTRHGIPSADHLDALESLIAGRWSAIWSTVDIRVVRFIQRQHERESDAGYSSEGGPCKHTPASASSADADRGADLSLTTNDGHSDWRTECIARCWNLLGRRVHELLFASKWTLGIASRTRCRRRRGPVMFPFSMAFPRCLTS
jgi:hypothetical protein